MMTGNEMFYKPKVSVVMSVYNGEKYLREAIESILNQTFTDFEFLIVNDGSTDGSLEIIQGYPDERIRVINNEQNIGLTRSLNKAISQAKGEYIARQDADDISLPERFEQQLRYFDQYPEVALLGTSVYKIDEQGRVVGRIIVPAEPGGNLLRANQFSHGSTIFKREVVDRLGGYNELFRYCQDYEFWGRIAKHYPVRNLPQPLYKLRFHRGNIRSQKRNESALYHLLAVRLVNNDLPEEILQVIKDNGILSLYPHLTKGEKRHFHTAVADMNMRNNDVKTAREEYWRVFRLNPFSISNNVNMALSYLGKWAWTVGHRVYEVFR
ncbi:MAG: hypothetical protein DRI01_08460 [Chloroflexi bacterium]|nr:MAG: hypothetical protein DRI01_08460 [Chloroflexota bacterium]